MIRRLHGVFWEDLQSEREDRRSSRGLGEEEEKRRRVISVSNLANEGRSRSLWICDIFKFVAELLGN